MVPSDTNPDYRERYEEFPKGDETIAKISDPTNPDAWIESTVTHDVEP